VSGVANCRHGLPGGHGPPVEYDWEIRYFFRDPDGHVLEISQTKT